ncbi:MAG: Ser-Thr-rich GPI-anchored membrane family protein [Bacteroidia bacterium]|nr:hypothetical protein [Bacteroidota bacterium]
MRLFLLWLFLGLVSVQSFYAQNVSAINVESVGDDSVRITYTLNDPSPERSYQVDIFAISRKDTFQLTTVSGQVGDSITAGTHSVVWDALAQLGRFRGPLAFRVRAIPSFLINDPSHSDLKLKRGTPYTFSWYGGNSHLDDLALVLYQYDNPIDTIKVVSQVNQYTWQIPQKLATGKGYRVKIAGTPMTNINEFTHSFSINRKVPLYYIIVPAATVVTGLVTYLIVRRKPLPEAPDPNEK